MITLDDIYRLEDFGLRAWLEHDHPITPVTTEKTIAIPGMAGLWDFGTEIRERRMGLPMQVNERDRMMLQHKLSKFVTFFHDEFGRKREVKLVFDYEPDKFYKVKLAGQITPERLAHAGKFVLPVVAYDPYKYSKTYADEVTWGSEEITFESFYLLGHTNDFAGEPIHITRPQTVNITASGLAVEPVIYIEGTANNLTLNANGHSFYLPNFSNTKWEIDFNRYVVFRNGQETMIDIRNFYLMPGNNQIQVTGNNIDIEMRVKFRDKYN